MDASVSNIIYKNSVFYYELGLYDEALKYINITLKIDPRDPRYYSKKAQIYHAKGNRITAIDYYIQALHIQNNDAESHYNLGLAYFDEGRYAESILSYTKAIEIERRSKAITFTNRGAAYFGLREYSLAISDYTTAINIDSHETKAYLMRGQIYMYQQSLENAKIDFEKVITTSRNPEEIQFASDGLKRMAMYK